MGQCRKSPSGLGGIKNPHAQVDVEECLSQAGRNDLVVGDKPAMDNGKLVNMLPVFGQAVSKEIRAEALHLAVG